MGLVEDLANEIIKRVIFDVVLKNVAAKALLAAPWLGVWPLNPVFMFVLNKIASKIYEELALAASFEIINFRTEQERKAYEDAKAALRQQLQGGTDDARKKAEEEFNRRLADLIRIKH